MLSGEAGPEKKPACLAGIGTFSSQASNFVCLLAPQARAMTTQKHPKRCSKSSGCGSSEAKHPESCQKRFLIPNRYHEHPTQFYLGLVPKPGAKILKMPSEKVGRNLLSISYIFVPQK